MPAPGADSGGEGGALRLFVALHVPAAVRERLAAEQRRLTNQGAPLRWTRPEGLHLTLAFLGATAPSAVLPLSELLSAVARRTHPFQLHAEGLGCFPSSRRPRVLWAGIEGDLGALHALQQQVIQALRRLGLPVEERQYQPHLTLGRAAGSRLAPLDALLSGAACSFGAWECREVALVQSFLGRGGSQYVDLHRASFADAGTA